MNIFRVNTTSWNEEDFLLVTDLSEQDVIDAVTPIVEAERNDGKVYYNQDLVNALKERFPTNKVDFITIDNITI